MNYPGNFMDFEPVATLYEKGDRSIRATMITTDRNRKYLDIRVWSEDEPLSHGVYLTGDSVKALAEAVSKFQEMAKRSEATSRYSFARMKETLGYNPFEDH